MNKELNVKDVELAERYVIALQTIKELEDEERFPNDDDVEKAERYVIALQTIKELEE